MFTGIVREQGVILSVDHSTEGSVIAVGSSRLAPELESGHSISIDGVCLTVTEFNSNSFAVEATPETVRLSNLNSRKIGDRVNLEPSLRLSDFLGGHLVQGHVDGVGRIRLIRTEGNSRIFGMEVPDSVFRFCVYKGSITVNGVSLTISALNSKVVEVTIIPHTFAVTNFSWLRVGDAVNLEADVISKYVASHVARLLGGAGTGPGGDDD